MADSTVNNIDQRNTFGNNYNYDHCVFIQLDGKSYNATDDVLSALTGLLGQQLRDAISKNISFLVEPVGYKSPEEQKEDIDEKIQQILQLSLTICDPSHKFKLKKFHIFSKSNDSKKEKEGNDSKTSDSAKGDTNEKGFFDKVVEAIKKANDQIDETTIKAAVQSMISYDDTTIDSYSYDYGSVFKQIINALAKSVQGGYDAIMKGLDEINDVLERYVEPSKIDMYHEDHLTPLDISFKYAILDEAGKDVAYSYNEEEKGKFEFFIERVNAKGEYAICCVIRDWNRAFADFRQLAYEIEYDAGQEYIKLDFKSNDGEGFDGQAVFSDYELVAYRECVLSRRGFAQEAIRYSDYKNNGGKIFIISQTVGCEISGEIELKEIREVTIKRAGDTKLPETKKYHFFVSFHKNESDKHLEEKEKKVFKPADRRFLRCPYCGQKLNFAHAWFARGRYCNGEKFKKKDTFSERQKKSTLCRYNCYLDSGFCNENGKLSDNYYLDPNKTIEASARPQPEKPLIIPHDYLKSNSGVVSLIGMSGSGKSVFISNLFNLQSMRFGNNPSWNNTIAPFIDDSQVGFFLPTANNETEWAEKQSVTYPYNPQIDHAMASYADYVSTIFGKVAKRSPNNKKDVLTYLPFIIRMENTKNGVRDYISFFDCPGEYIYKVNIDKSVERPLLSDKNKKWYPALNSDAFVLFLDPFDDTNGTVSEKFISAAQILSNLVDLYDKRDAKNKVVAVVFSKFDVLINQLRNSSEACNGSNVQEFLDAVCMSAPQEDSKGRVNYSASKTSRYIDSCSDAIEAFFKESRDQEAFETFCSELDNFGNRKFFMISALGRGGSIQFSNRTDDNFKDTPNLLYRARSNYDVDKVVLWMAVQLGMIR